MPGVEESVTREWGTVIDSTWSGAVAGNAQGK